MEGVRIVRLLMQEEKCKREDYRRFVATGRGSCKDVDSTDDIGREGSSVGERK